VCRRGACARTGARRSSPGSSQRKELRGKVRVAHEHARVAGVHRHQQRSRRAVAVDQHERLLRVLGLVPGPLRRVLADEGRVRLRDGDPRPVGTLPPFELVVEARHGLAQHAFGHGPWTHLLQLRERGHQRTDVHPAALHLGDRQRRVEAALAPREIAFLPQLLEGKRGHGIGPEGERRRDHPQLVLVALHPHLRGLLPWCALAAAAQVGENGLRRYGLHWTLLRMSANASASVGAVQVAWRQATVTWSAWRTTAPLHRPCASTNTSRGSSSTWDSYCAPWGMGTRGGPGRAPRRASTA